MTLVDNSTEDKTEPGDGYIFIGYIFLIAIYGISWWLAAIFISPWIGLFAFLAHGVGFLITGYTIRNRHRKELKNVDDATP